jgi:hypothetical protein
MSRRYCPMCETWHSQRTTVCPACGMDTELADKPRKLTRQEQLEGLADRGTDTHEEYRSEP